MERNFKETYKLTPRLLLEGITELITEPGTRVLP